MTGVLNVAELRYSITAASKYLVANFWEDPQNAIGRLMLEVWAEYRESGVWVEALHKIADVESVPLLEQFFDRGYWPRSGRMPRNRLFSVLYILYKRTLGPANAKVLEQFPKAPLLAEQLRDVFDTLESEGRYGEKGRLDPTSTILTLEQLRTTATEIANS